LTSSKKERFMVNVGLLVTLEAKEGQEDEVASFLASAEGLVNDEPDTVAWFAIRMGPSTFGIFDAFPDDNGRDAHLNGRVAEALMGRAEELFSQSPSIEKVDVIASKLPG
jgi:quinol monooxygenase YgiN